MAVLFAEPGGSPQQGAGLFSSTSGSIAVDNLASPAPPSGSNGYSIKADTTASPATAFVARTALLGSNGRVSGYFMFANVSGSDSVQSLRILDSGGTGVAGVTFTQTQAVALNDGSGTVAPTVWGTSAGTYNLNQWYRWAVTWNWTSQTVNAFKLYIDGVQIVSVTNKTLLGTLAPNVLRLGWGGAVPGASRVMRFAHVYVDDDSSLADPGDVRCTAKQYVGTSEDATNNAFDTALGTAVATLGSRYLALSERPNNDSNGWQHAATTQKIETFTLQAASAGDADIAAATLIGWMHWVRTKTASAATLTNTDNSVDVTGISNTTTITNFLHLTTSATYPTGRFGVKSTGTTTDSFFYEGGIVAAYVPGAAVTGGPAANSLALLGVGT